MPMSKATRPIAACNWRSSGDMDFSPVATPVWRAAGIWEGSATAPRRCQNKKWARPKPKQKVVTTFIFQVRNIPAALYKALGGFATNGINMTKLESYMVGGSFSATQFYADVEGHPDHPALKRALSELDYFCKKDTLRVLGVYAAHKFRDTLD